VGTLIDTSILIAAARDDLDFGAIRSHQPDEPLAMAAITAAEVLVGVHRVREAVSRARMSAIIEEWLASIPVVSFDLHAARVHALLAVDLRARGALVGAHDLIIAATAVARDDRIATRDLRSFPKIRGLDVVRW
jgi:tRNA(fMet)-specific endonuclease VapC